MNKGKAPIFVYYLLYLDNQSIEEYIHRHRWSKNLLSYSMLEKERFILVFEFSHADEFESFFEENLTNFVNAHNGIWINERPVLHLAKNNGNSRLEEYYNIVHMSENYIEISYDADYLRVFFTDKNAFLEFIHQVRSVFDVLVDEVVYEGCIQLENK